MNVEVIFLNKIEVMLMFDEAKSKWDGLETKQRSYSETVQDTVWDTDTAMSHTV